MVAGELGNPGLNLWCLCVAELSTTKVDVQIRRNLLVDQPQEGAKKSW